MICPLCRKFNVRRLRIERGIEIFECRQCELGFTNNVTNLMRPHQFGNTLYDFEGYKKEEKKLRKRFERMIEIIIKYKKSGEVLDIGAGFGLFSSILARSGRYQIDIIESNLKPYYLRSIPHAFYKVTLERFLAMTKLRDRGDLSIKGKNKKYDLIILMDVVEHLENPFESLKRIKSFLVKGGILVIQTPNYKSLMARICHDWAWWMIEDHKYFFSPKSIRIILAKVGLAAKFFITYEDLPDFKKNLDGNFTLINNIFLRKIIKTLFYSIFFPTYLIARKLLWKFNYGGLIFVIAKKS